MTPADDLPPLPVFQFAEGEIPGRLQDKLLMWRDECCAYWRMRYESALAARAELDALNENQRKNIQILTESMQARGEQIAELGEALALESDAITQRDEKIKELELEISATSDAELRLRVMERQRAEAAEAEVMLSKAALVSMTTLHEAAEARVKELEEQWRDIGAICASGWTFDNLVRSPNEWAEALLQERDTLQARVAELEEKLMVMCVAQMNEAGVGPIRAWIRGHMSSYGGVSPPEYDEECVPGDDQPEGEGWIPLVQLKQLVPSPDPPAPAALAAHGVDSEPK